DARHQARAGEKIRATRKARWQAGRRNRRDTRSDQAIDGPAGKAAASNRVSCSGKATALSDSQSSMIAWTIYLTFAGAVVLLVFPGVVARWIALLTTVAGLLLGVVAFVRTPVADLAHFMTIVSVPWVPPLGLNY